MGNYFFFDLFGNDNLRNVFFEKYPFNKYIVGRQRISFIRALVSLYKIACKYS